MVCVPKCGFIERIYDCVIVELFDAHSNSVIER